MLGTHTTAMANLLECSVMTNSPLQHTCRRFATAAPEYQRYSGAYSKEPTTADSSIVYICSGLTDTAMNRVKVSQENMRCAQNSGVFV